MQPRQECQHDRLEQSQDSCSMQVGEHQFTAKIQSMKCSQCGMLAFCGPDLEKFELAVAIKLANAGEMNGEIARFLRKALGLKAKELAILLNVVPETVSRWENNKIVIDHASAALLCTMVFDMAEGRETAVKALKSLLEPQPLPQNVSIKVKEVAA